MRRPKGKVFFNLTFVTVHLNGGDAYQGERLRLVYREDRKMEGVMALGTRLVREEEGQTLIEYALIAAIISIGVIVVMYFLRNSLRTVFSTVGSVVGEQPT